MSTKSKLLAEIEKKSQKIRDKRIDAANNKSLEAVVFEFFRNIEQSRLIDGNKSYDPTLFEAARKSLQSRIRSFDCKAKITIRFNAHEDLTSWVEPQVRGVTIWWGQAHIVKNNIDPSLYIDVSEMLFF